MTYTINNPGHGYSFGVNYTTQAAHQIASQKGPINTTVRVIGSYSQIWYKFIWFTLGYKHLNTQGSLYLEQNQPWCPRNMGWIPLELCSHSVILKYSRWFGTDGSHHPCIYWVVQMEPNGCVPHNLCLLPG